MKLLLFICLAMLCCARHTYAGDTLRVCTYYLLNYSDENEDERSAQFKSIVEQIRPDILVVQDIAGQDAAFRFFTDVLNPEVWSLSTYNDGPGTDNMVYFKFDKLAFLDGVHHSTAYRDISEYRLHLKSTGDTITVFSVHFTSGDSDDDAAARDAESVVLRNRVLEHHPSQNIIACGNFNYYSTAELGYIRLVMSDASFLLDPEGGWVRNEENWSWSFTQSTRTTADGNCGGGVGGGLDDRFDLLLLSPPLVAGLVPGSQKVFGNDHQPRLNEAINDPPNTAVSAELAAALRCASDHLPVYADLVFGTPTDVKEYTAGDIDVKLYPTPVGDDGRIDIASPVPQTLIVTIGDITGRSTSYEIAVGTGRNTFPLPVLPAGVYWCRVLGAGSAISVPFIVVR